MSAPEEHIDCVGPEDKDCDQTSDGSSEETAIDPDEHRGPIDFRVCDSLFHRDPG
jgi:hypothetical protein